MVWLVQRDPDCLKTLQDGGILGRAASAFGMDASYVRVELLMRPEEFDMLIQMLDKLART
jgi:Allinase